MEPTRRPPARTTPPRPVDVEARWPALAAHRTDGVRLHPRRGEPGPYGSSLGGPVLWPRGAPWPHCARRHPRRGARVRPPRGPVPLVPVLQLFAADLPDGGPRLPFPAGVDLLQVLWCPFDHHRRYLPHPELRWWDSARPGLVPADPPRPAGAPAGYLPLPCVLHPERVVEYPVLDLSDEEYDALEPEFRRCEAQTGWSYQAHLAAPGGTKAAGYPVWAGDPDWPHCAGCGRRTVHLLSIGAPECAAAELGPAGRRAWLPVEDDPAGDPEALRRPHGLALGDPGGIQLFVCAHCPDRPHTLRHGF
ncbi:MULTISPECIES: hypothetical protein [Kitasatospora]|uniref:DUF1963 domain-containing protein n=1 Tax=Kitasatospora setae (strain ATCC 33774 / DSM 43861 / JCM 3304 / KCC A-0304 / NBRC 14216 / KM-6054) TaxID=452652 RepID=E4N6V4_KITSK|nr:MULTISPECIES: hypothetical protein [Kitasatospora]BAJ26935.1 hypothetical protein KSE_11010 [Kitasatospora setae KM-6054]